MSNNQFKDLLNVVMENESLLKFYASRKCKECLSKGFVEFAFPGEHSKPFVCSCVYKSIKKELSQNNTV
tara:strand:+ start:288 stop:494 length:207 start_codon:yes stop_codon:yes gene_type:complete